MKDGTPKTIYLKDYTPSKYSIEDVHLTFNLDDKKTYVKSKMTIVRREMNETGSIPPLVLNGEEIELKNLWIDGVKLKDDEYEVGDDVLIIPGVPESFVLEIENTNNPSANKALDGLYKSGDIFCTQNEAEGFRRITYYLDRPDVMAKFTTKIIADKKKYPVLLSNGNPIDSGDLDDGKHFVVWEDPFLKPCYLYALVAGDLGLVEDQFTTMSGRVIDLRIYCDKGNEKKCFHAMESLKNSMKWDEETFSLEYDLDIYMIVAVDSFNMGAMENKGLNIFNSSCVLANQETATDHDFLGIEGVVGHEYFHNWTGNRITCRDWFQLTLKEGLTVYRDQEFSGDMNDPAVQRISDVSDLKSFQFVEDSGPNSHAIRPDHYMEINNFYTATVYSKGAEVIRMLRTFFHKEGFRKGMDKYFELYDGKAVTTDDFLHAMSVANDNYNLEQFKRWYFQSGTPEIQIHTNFDEKNATYTLTIEQFSPPSTDQVHKQPYHLPLKFGLVAKDGTDLPIKEVDSDHLQEQIEEGILHIRHEKEVLIFKGIAEMPVLSINRGFSAPVKLHIPYHNDELIFLFLNDSDHFNRFEAGQTIISRLIFSLLKDYQNNTPLKLDENYIKAFGKLLEDQTLSMSFKAQCLSIPSESILHQGHSPIDIEGIYKVRRFVMSALGRAHRKLFENLYDQLNVQAEFKIDPEAMGNRKLKNRCLEFLVLQEDRKAIDLCLKQYKSAGNMTDEFATLFFLSAVDCPEREECIKSFYDKWQKETLVMQKWLMAQSMSPLDSTYENILALESSPVYDKTVPNLFRALYRGFVRNHRQFHHSSGRGYKLVAERVLEMDKINPQMASGLANGAFSIYKKLNEGLREKMKVELDKIIAQENLSNNLYEIISKILH